MAKLRLMREDEEIKNLLSTKFDREVLVQLLGILKIDINEILGIVVFQILLYPKLMIFKLWRQ